MDDKNSSGARAALAAQSRGSSYPFIDLKEAIARAKKFFEKEGRAAAPITAAVEHWGYAEKSSGGRQTVSTLIQYGLMRDEGSSEQRKVALTRLALDILLLPPESPEWLVAVQRAARSPKLFAEVLTVYQETGLPSDTTLKHFLVTEMGISISAVDSAIKNLRATVTLAKIDGSDKISPASPPPAGAEKDEAEYGGAEVGDLIQWVSGGSDQFDTPRRVRAIQAHEGQDWVFVEGSLAGIPMSEVTVQQKAPAAPKGQPPVLPIESPAPGLPSEVEWLRGPLSKDLSYRLLVTGDIGPKEIGKLIKILEAQKLILSEDDD